MIDAAFTDIIKEIVPQYAVTDILGKRDEIRSKTKELLAKNLSRYGITVDDVYLTQIAFSPEYTAAIEAKQVAAQQVEQQRQILEQKRVQADQAEAEALGRARAVVAEADGQAAANRKLASRSARRSSITSGSRNGTASCRSTRVAVVVASERDTAGAVLIHVVVVLDASTGCTGPAPAAAPARPAAPAASPTPAR